MARKFEIYNNKFEKELNFLTKFHYKNSKKYKNILDLKGFNLSKTYSLENLPFIPARIFKDIELKSINNKNIFKVLQSSGTSSSSPSKIFLDKENANKQRIVLAELFKSFVTRERLPMLVIGENPLNNKNNFDAKTAAILGFSIFTKYQTFIKDKANKVNYKLLNTFLKTNKNKKFLIFGFTSDVYFSLNEISKKIKQDLSKAILLHGGGWKKLENKKISNTKFNKFIIKNFNIKKIINYYGLIEQVGSIFFECSNCNVFVCSKYSDIIIRDKSFNVKVSGKGIVQLLSKLPTSYPGHNILTEDYGEILSTKGCKCGLNGKTFKIYGRIKESEVRGCSNV